MRLRLSILLGFVIAGLGGGCSSSEPEPAGRGSAALTGEIPSSSPEYDDWAWTIWDGETGVSITVGELGATEDDLLALDCYDAEGDGDFELSLEAGDARVFVDGGSRVEVRSGAALVLIDELTGDFEVAAGDASVAGALAAAAAAEASAAAALGTVDVCTIEPEAAIEVCFATITAANACAAAGLACDVDTLVETTAAACIAALSALTAGAEACDAMLATEIEGWADYAERFRDYDPGA
jgi:hypothetical protein